MIRCISYLIMVAVLVSGSWVLAKDIHVNNTTGYDRNLGQSAGTVDGLAGPVKTIARAIELSEQGDRIILAPTGSPYRESICLFGKKQSGDEFNDFSIEGNGAILDGTELLPLEVWSHAFGNTFRFRPSKFTYFQLFEAGRPLQRIAVESGAKIPPPLAEMEWCICSGFVYICLENFKRPQDYRFIYSEKMTGITIMQTTGVRINDLIVQGYQIDGISIVNNTKNVVLDNVIVRGNGRNGLTVGAASTVAVGYSLFGDNNSVQIAMDERSELLLFLSELKGTDAPLKTLKSANVAQSAKLNNNGGTLRQIGADGVTQAEVSQKPDIANLWGQLIPVSMTEQKTDPPSLLTATRVEENSSSAQPIQESDKISMPDPKATDAPAPFLPVDEPPLPTDDTDTIPDDDSPFWGDVDLGDNDNPFGL